MYEKDQARFQDTKNPFVVADLGCADGIISARHFKTIVEAVRDINPDLPIIIYLNDLPFTDLTKAQVIVAQTLKEHRDIFIYSIPKTFHDRVFPANTVDFIITNLALFWLSSDLDLPGLKGMLVIAEDQDNENGKKWLELAA